MRPRIWFPVTPKGKAVKDRVHLDLDLTEDHGFSLVGRRLFVDARSDGRVARGATIARVSAPPGADF